MSDVVSTPLLGIGSLVLVVAGVGAAAPPSAFVRLHYVSLATMLGVPLVVGGLLVRDPADWFKLVVIAVLLVATSPVATGATARALSRREAAEREAGP